VIDQLLQLIFGVWLYLFMMIYKCNMFLDRLNQPFLDQLIIAIRLFVYLE